MALDLKDMNLEKKDGGDLKKRIVFTLLFCGLLFSRGYAAEEADVSSRASRILNLWCESRVVGNKSFDLDAQVQRAVKGEEAPAFHSWDLLLKHVGLAQQDKKNPPQVKFGALYVLSESRRRAATHLLELATGQMVPILGGIQNEGDARLKRNVGYGDRFRSVMGVMKDARDMMNSGEELLNENPDRKDFERLRKYVTDEIDLYEDVVETSMDRVYAWSSSRDDKRKKKRAEEEYLAAQTKYESAIKQIRVDLVQERLELLKKHDLDQSRLAHGGNLLDRYAANLIKSEKQYEEKYL